MSSIQKELELKEEEEDYCYSRLIDSKTFVRGCRVEITQDSVFRVKKNSFKRKWKNRT